MDRATTIKIKNLTIGYQSHKRSIPIISSITESLDSGELTCLLGANGVGKSTLLKTIIKFIPKLSGEVYILNREIDTYSPDEIAKVVSVVLTQRPQVYNMTVEELVATGRTPYTNFFGTLKEDDKNIIEQSLKEIGINKLKDRYLNTLSDGEKQKALIAKALAQDTPIILLDEPTAFLDYPSKVEVLKLLHTLAHQKGKTILLSTHDMELTYQIADRIWLFSREKQLITGSPEDLALRGDIDKFLNNSSLYLEQYTGLFKIRNSVKGEVEITGDDTVTPHLIRALERIGFVNKPNSKIKIQAVSKEPLKIAITTDNTSLVVNSITALTKLPIFLG